MPNGEEIASVEVSINSSSQNDRSCTFHVPHEIGCYSVRGEKREYINGPDNKRYLRSDISWKGNKWDQPDMNLKDSQEHAVRRDWAKSASLENLLHWVCRNRDKVMPSSTDETQRNTLLGMWAVARLAGAPKVLCGFIDDDGILFSILNYDVSTIPEMAKGQWSEVIVMKFGQEMLSFIKEHVEENDERSVYLFEYVPSSSEVVCKRLTDPGSRYGFPDWFLAGFEGC